jgi:D-arabinose 1-dehydrogenase-like Zn-dependent alcohol dehydrogenase
VGSLQDLRDLLALARAGKAGRPAVATHRLHEAEDLLCALADGRITGRAVLVP